MQTYIFTDTGYSYWSKWLHSPTGENPVELEEGNTEAQARLEAIQAKNDQRKKVDTYTK